MEVRLKHLKGMHFQAEGSAKTFTQIDTSTTTGGTGMGASPMELILMALAGSSGMDVLTLCAKMQVNIERFEITAEGERANDYPKVFTDIEIVYQFWGKELPEMKIKRAITLSIEKYCSVLNMLDKVANITYRSEFNTRKY